MINKKKLDRAQIAVAEFRRLQPTLTAYAKNLTGRSDVRVQMSSGVPRTDGKTIYMSPTLNMADMTLVRHDKTICDKRDLTTFELYCRACAAREDVLATVYHEISHIAFESFAEVKKTDAETALRMMSEVAPDWYVNRAAEKFADQGYMFSHGFLELAGTVNPYLAALYNGLEDVRINARMADARPGTRVMMKAMIYGLAFKGVEQKDKDGKTVFVKYDKYDPNMQATIAAFCVASEYDTTGWFTDRVFDAMRDDEVMDHLTAAPDATSAREVFRIAFGVFMRLRELGFFKLVNEEPDPEPEPQPEPDTTEESEDDGEPDPSGSADDDGDASDPGGGDSGEADAPSPDARGGADGDGQDDGGSGSAGGPGDDGVGSDDSGSSDGDPGSESRVDGRDDDSVVDAAGGRSEDPRDDEPAAESAGSSGGDVDEAGEPEASTEPVASGPEPGRDDDSDGRGADEVAPDEHDGPAHDSRSHEGERGGDADGKPGQGQLDGDSDPGTGDTHSGPGDRGGADGELGDERLGDSGLHDGERSEAEGDGEVSSSGLDREADRGREDHDAPGHDDMVEGSDGSVASDADPLAYQPSEAIDATDEKIEPVKPTITSDQEITLVDMGLHRSEPPVGKGDEKAMEAAIAQAEYFELPSTKIMGVKVWKYEDRETDRVNREHHAWQERRESYRDHYGIDFEKVPESVLAPALMRMRLVFADNKRTQHDRNRKSGRIDTRVLGKRAWSGDDRLFGRKVQPGRKDYMVCIMLDVSGSTMGENLQLIKAAGRAQADLCSRMGIDFAVYAHTGSPLDDDNWEDLWVDFYEIKAADSPWDDKARAALDDLEASVCNLDGHTLEFARKLVEGMPQTNKIILYYSDGAMPAENHDEELEILTRNIQMCRQRNITLLGVGVHTDSPSRHGLDTVQINDSAEVGAVITHLERVLLR